MQLSPVQRRIRDFYFKEGLARAGRRHARPSRRGSSPTSSFSRSSTSPSPEQPATRPQLPEPVPGRQAGRSFARRNLYKLVQKRKIGFVDRRVLQQHLERGAACVLEGLDILEPEINTLATALDRGRAATFSNATAFFSQRGNEAYRGHVDTDDVLVIHMAGEKRWSLHRRQPPRRVNLADLDPAQMGPVEAEIVMRPGDVMYLRNYTPHRVETLSPYSLHVSFDLCDRQPSIEIALQMLLRHYDRDSSPRGTPPLEDLDKLFRLSRSPRMQRNLRRRRPARMPATRNSARSSPATGSRTSIASCSEPRVGRAACRTRYTHLMPSQCGMHAAEIDLENRLEIVAEAGHLAEAQVFAFRCRGRAPCPWPRR